ncbi:hypothetical protein ACTMU2_41760 [Cupriavidus basilensis]
MSAAGAHLPDERGGDAPGVPASLPSSMKNLQPDVRARRRSRLPMRCWTRYGEGVAIRIAIAQAHRWACNAEGDAVVKRPAQHRL